MDMSKIHGPNTAEHNTPTASEMRRRHRRTRLLLTACFLAAPGLAHAQDTTIGAGETQGSQLNMDGADTLTVATGGTLRVTGNQAVNINGESTGDGILITNDGTIEAVPTSDSNGRAITGSTPAVDRTLTIINRGDIIGASDAIRIADSSSNPSGGGTITIDNSGRIISNALTSAGLALQRQQAIEMGVAAGTLDIINRDSAVIEGPYGIQSNASVTTIVNAGRIAAVGTSEIQGEAVRTSLTSSQPDRNPVLHLTNEASGVIVGGYGVTALGDTTIVNRGTIMGDSDNPVSHSRTAIRVINNFEGQNNSILLAAGSVTAAGSGEGASGQAISFSGSKSGTNRLTIETGATIVGSLRAATSANIDDTLELTGSGEQILGSAEDFDRLEVTGGSWGITNSMTVRNGATIASGATLRLDDREDGGGGLLRGGAIENNGTLVINRSASLSQAYDPDGEGGADPIHAAISGTGSLRLTGTDTFALTTANSYSGDTRIESGRLRTDSDNVLSAASAMIVTGDGVLDLNDGATDAEGNAVPGAHSQTVANLSGDGSVRTGTLTGATLTTGGAGGDSIFSGTVSELGGVTKVGSGTLTLSGANSASGALRVSAGAVVLSGSWAGNAAVEAGAALGGNGTIAGALSVEGAIAPGQDGIGLLTTGGLTLSEGALLAYDLGAPGNGDRIAVNGDLTLDGTLNITDVGGFGEGVYRLIDYSGTLTDNGLLVGTIPAGADAGIMDIQTSIASQVNLVYGAPDPAAVLFWDGAGPSGNHVVDGGSGSWTNASPRWTDANGDVNSSWGGRFAVFQGAAGTVTVDDAIEFTGAQFMTDGYVVAGGTGALSAVDPLTNIRVDPGITATIAADIGGTGGLVKNDSGTLILSGSNDYAGETRIEGGTLRVIGGSAIPVTSELMVGAGGTLDVRADQTIGNLSGSGAVLLADADLSTGALGGATTFDGVISGSGGVTKTGSGVFTLTGANQYSGATEVAGGTLVVDGSVAGDINVSTGSTLSGVGSAAGVVTLADGATLSAGGSAAAIFTSGGLILSETSVLDFSLGAPNVAGASDRLQVNGDLTLDGRLDVTDIGGFGIGVYRLIDYGGTLTDHGLLLGALPGGIDPSLVEVQTSTASQVNLVFDNATPEIQFWDGAGVSSNGEVEGGSGSWTNDRSSWTAADGSGNARWGGRFAVFQGKAGTVTVDDAIAFSGMQFMTDGYIIAAGSGSLTATEAQTNIRVDPGVTATITAAIGGAGGLDKLDSGTLILGAANSYAGETWISGGTLRAGADGALPEGTAVTVAGGATLDVAADQSIASLAGSGTVQLSSGDLATGSAGVDTRFDGTISGSGGLTKTGSGIFTLAGSNDYAGGTTVAGGTLRLDDGTIGSGDLAIAASAILDLNGSDGAVGDLRGSGEIRLGAGTLAAGATDDTEFAGAISGSGGLIKTGAGDLTLSGANSFTGGTMVNEGLLVAGAAGSFGTGPLYLAEEARASFGTYSQSLDGLAGAGALDLGSGTLTLNGAEATTYSGTMSGTGGLTLAGTGSLTLSGDNSYSGATTVSGGRLIVNGSLASTVSVGANGELGGSGRIGGLTVSGTVAPGNSIGTLAVDGALTFASNSTYQVEIAPDGRSDRIDASGAVTIQGGTVEVLADGATDFANVTNYTILTGTAVTGTFDTVTTDLAFLTPTLIYDAADVRLRMLRNGVALADVAETPNQLAVASTLDTAPEGELFDQLINLSADGARDAYDQLAGEIHVAGAALASRDAHDASRALLDRMAMSSGEGLQLWVEGGFGDITAKAGHGLARVKANRTAFAGGIELGSDGWRGGLAYRRTTSDFDAAARGSFGDLATDSVHAYVAHDMGAWRIAGGAGLSTHAIDIERQVDIGSLSNRLHSREKGISYVGFAELSYRADLSGVTLEPYAGLSLAATHLDGARETGGPEVLWVSGGSETTTVAGYGLRFGKSFGGFALAADLGGRSYLGSDIDRRLVSFQEGAPFAIEGARFGRHRFAGRVDATYVAGHTTFGVGVRGEAGKQGSSYSLRATIGHRF